MTALGAKAAMGDTPVVSIAGDGGFLFGVQELATAAQFGLNVVSIVFDNGAYGNVRRDQIRRFQGRELGSYLENPDFLEMAESFGVMGLRAETPADLKPALEKAFAANAPVLIHCPVTFGSEADPWPYIIEGR
jgi:acetolactate synthase-1/2/3 large subunit